MLKNIYLKIALGLVALVVLLLLITTLLVEPWIGRKIETKLNEESKDYQIGIGTVNVSLLKSGITLENLTITPRKGQKSAGDLTGEIASISVNGIRFINILLKKEIEISEVTIFDSRITGIKPETETPGPPKISSLNLRIDHLFFNKINLSLRDHLSAKSYLIRDGFMNVYDLKVAKQDTLSPSILNHFDFEAEELRTVSSDSMYTYKVSRFKYAETTKNLAVFSFSIHPNFSNYAFTSRNKYQSDRIEAEFGPILVQGFSVSELIKSGSLIGSEIEIGKMDVKTFRDKRKEFEHVNRPSLQDLIDNYPASVKIDSISILSGSVAYQEHAIKANEPGRISFTEINAKIYKISNDTIYKKEEAYLKFNVEALLMGKGKLAIQYKGRLFDPQNTFSLIGNLSGMDVSELNPILEKSSFISATSGNVDALDFNLTANNNKATGELVLLYHGLNVALINKRTDETTAVKERLGSFVANIKILDSNPLPGKAVRRGIIDYQRDPEKFLFNYCFRSILSGIKSGLTNQEKK